MNGESKELRCLADINNIKDTELYKIFEDDIDFLDYFFSFESKANEFNNIETFLNSHEFSEIRDKFENYIRKKSNGFNWILTFLSYLYGIRPKLLPIIIILIGVSINFYSSYIKEINFSIQYEKFKVGKLYLQPLVHYLFFSGYNNNNNNQKIDENSSFNWEIMKNNLIKNQNLLTFYPKIFDETYKNNQNYLEDNIDDVFRIIFYDQEDQLKLFLENHSEFDINSPIDITNNNKLNSLLLLINSEISLLDLCCFFGSSQCFKYLYLNGYQTSYYTLKYSIYGGNSEIIQILNHDEYEFNYCCEYSIRCHRYEITDWLLANFKCDCFSEHTSILNYNFKSFIFLRYNSNPNEFFIKCDLPLLNSFSMIGDLSIFIKLYSNLKKYCTKKDLVEAFSFAIAFDYLPIFKFILSLGISINYRFKGSITPFHKACDYSSLSIIQYLISQGCNKEIEDLDGNKPLHNACLKGHLPIIKYLISIGCNKESKNKNGETPLHFACLQGHLPIVQYLISIGCNKELKNRNGETPLHYACFHDHLGIVEYLISIGCNKESRNKRGDTLLHYACLGGHILIVKYLFSIGCYKNPLNIAFMTPYFYASHMYHKQVIEYLKSQGCNTSTNWTFLKCCLFKFFSIL